MFQKTNSILLNFSFPRWSFCAFFSFHFFTTSLSFIFLIIIITTHINEKQFLFNKNDIFRPKCCCTTFSLSLCSILSSFFINSIIQSPTLKFLLFVTSGHFVCSTALLFLLHQTDYFDYNKGPTIGHSFILSFILSFLPLFLVTLSFKFNPFCCSPLLTNFVYFLSHFFIHSIFFSLSAHAFFIKWPSHSFLFNFFFIFIFFYFFTSARPLSQGLFPLWLYISNTHTFFYSQWLIAISTYIFFFYEPFLFPLHLVLFSSSFDEFSSSFVW